MEKTKSDKMRKKARSQTEENSRRLPKKNDHPKVLYFIGYSCDDHPNRKVLFFTNPSVSLEPDLPSDE